MKTKTHEKLNISIPIDLHDFLLKKQKSEQQINPLATIPLSRIVATAIREYKENEEGKAQADAGVNALKASENFVSMSSTATKKSSRRAG
jgi:hypothetical protein